MTVQPTIRALALSCLLLAFAPGIVSAQSGRFDSAALVEFSPDGRSVVLKRAFKFTDTQGQEWRVPVNTVVDGASIPQPFWSLIGGPFEGKYRDASIVHDYFCEKKNRSWRAVHRVFYDGMIANGVDPVQAKLMYYAVYRFGPRWEIRTERVPVPQFSGPPRMVDREIAVELPSAEYNAADVEAALALIASSNPSLEDLDRLADSDDQ